MENGRQDRKISCRTVLPDAVTSSRFPCSFQGKFHPVNANVPFEDKRVLMHDIPEGNEANRVHQIRRRSYSKWAVSIERARGNRGYWHVRAEIMVGNKKARNCHCLSWCTQELQFEGLLERNCHLESAAQAVSNKDEKEYKFVTEHSLTKMKNRTS